MDASVKAKLEVLKEKFEDLKQTKQEKSKSFFSFLDILSNFLGRLFEINDDEVSILVTNKDASILSFAKPDYLRKSGFIPISAQSSVAVDSLNMAKARVFNKPSRKTLCSIFEHVVHPEKQIHPVQKMMVIPLIYEKQKLGVVELTRKAKSLAEAGPDFTKDDLSLAIQVLKSILPYFAHFKIKDYKAKLSES